MGTGSKAHKIKNDFEPKKPDHKPQKQDKPQSAPLANAVKGVSQMSREQDYITLARQHAKNFLDAYNGLKSLQLEWNALNYSADLDDGVGANEGITKTEVGSVVFDTTDAITTLLNAGHSTNLHRLL
jgi:hypothetical protein